MNRIVITTDIERYNGTIVAAGSSGQVFAFNRDTCNFSVKLDDGTYISAKAWEFDRIEENA